MPNYKALKNNTYNFTNINRIKYKTVGQPIDVNGLKTSCPLTSGRLASLLVPGASKISFNQKFIILKDLKRINFNDQYYLHNCLLQIKNTALIGNRLFLSEKQTEDITGYKSTTNIRIFKITSFILQKKL